MRRNTTGEANTAIGINALSTNSTGSRNVAVGNRAGGGFGHTYNTPSSTGNNNTSVGTEAGVVLSTGAENTIVGSSAGSNNTTGSYNCFIGKSTGQGITTGSKNTIIGYAGALPTNLEETVVIGSHLYTGLVIKDGMTGLGKRFNGGMSLNSPSTYPKNVLEIEAANPSQFGKSGLRLTNVKNGIWDYNGAVITPSSAYFNPRTNPTNNILTVDGNGDVYLVKDKGIGNTCTTLNSIPRTSAGTGDLSCSQIYDSNVAGVGGVGINTTTPGNRFEIKHGTAGKSGLRFTNLTNVAVPIANTAKGVLSVDVNGDVVLVTSSGSGGISSTCTSSYNIPTSTGATGNLTCGQVFDNGATVSIGTPLTNANAVTYTLSGIPPLAGGTVPFSGVVKLDVNGIIRTTGIFATSDRKFKQDIKTIDNALNVIQNLEGRTYHWKKEANKDLAFDDNTHSGFVAQEIEKVLPHLVATSENGDKAVNYQELTPYLVEAIKEQQNQIVALNNRIEDLLLKEVIDEHKITDGKTYFSSNYPNPFETITKIDYFIDKNIKDAQVVVYDVNGSTISRYDLRERGISSNFTINKGNLVAGIYFYTLITDGTVIGTKKMIVK